MNNDFVSDITRLIKSALSGEPAVLSNALDYSKVYRFASMHKAVPLIYYGLVNSKVVLEPEQEAEYFSAVCRNLSVCEYQTRQLAQLLECFEKEGIDHMPLKGGAIRELYPKPELRLMNDADVLIRIEQYDKIVPILEKAGFEFVKENDNELVWSKNTLCLELHRYLISPGHEDYFRLVGDGWQFARRADGFRHRYIMSDEDFYVYMILHIAKHYRYSGIGIRHFTDVWVYRQKKTELDMEYVQSQLEKLGLSRFNDSVIKTVDVWFNDAEPDEVTELMTKRIISSGAFGTTDAANMSSALKEIKTGGAKNIRISRLCGSAFPPYKNMCILFPILKKVPVLLPFLWIWRIIYTAVCKKGTFTKHYNDIKALTPDSISQYERELKAVGLEFKVEE